MTTKNNLPDQTAPSQHISIKFIPYPVSELRFKKEELLLIKKSAYDPDQSQTQPPETNPTQPQNQTSNLHPLNSDPAQAAGLTSPLEIEPQGKCSGRCFWLYPDGVMKAQSGYLEGLLHGEHRDWHPNGQLKTEGAYRRGYKYGCWRTYNEAGQLSEEVTLRSGVKHGLCRTFASDGSATETVFVAGRDDLIGKSAEKKFKTMAGKIKKAKNNYKKLDIARADIEYNAAVVMLWHLHQSGYLDLAVDPELWMDLADNPAAASPTEVFELLRKIQSYDHNDVETQRFVSFWPEALDRLVAQAYAWEPEAFSHWRELPTPVRDGVALVLRRFGVISREELPCHTVEALALRHVAQYPLNDCPWVPIEGSRGVADGKIESAGQWPGERFEAYIQQFCDMDTWSKASLAAANQTLSRLNMTSAVHGLTIAPLKNLAALLKSIEATKGQLYHFLIHLRADAPEELFKIVHELQADRPYIADPVRYAAILRCKAVGVPVPEGIEVGTTLQSYEGITGKSNKNFEGMEQVIEALHTLGEKRAVALLRGVLASPYYKDHALPFLAEFDDPTLWEEARAAINTFTDKNFPAMELTAYSLGRLPPIKLSWIIQTYDASPDVKDLREGLARAALHILAGIGDRGEFVEDHVADAFIKFEGWEAKGLGDYYYENYVKDLLLRALKAIPRDRAINLVQAQLDVNRLRPFAALAILQDPATTTLAFDKLSASAETFDSGMSASVKEGVKSLGDQAHLEIRRLLATAAHPALVKIFREAMGDAMFMALSNDSVVKEETLEQQIRRLSGQLPVVKTRIYALNRASEDHKVTGLSRIGGTPPPLPDERWPKFEKQKMEFLLSLDLTHLPELSKPNSNAAVVALYLSSLSDNTACTPHNKESALVWLTHEEVLAWKPLLLGDSGVGMSVEAIDVPIEALCLTEKNILENYEKELDELHRLIYALPGRVLGSPIWLQQDEAPGSRFLFQFDNVLVDVNLGDSGVMYVFEDTAFWQCH